MPRTAADIMTRDVVVVQFDTSIREVAELLASRKYGAVPVIDADGTLAGMVTEEDMVLRAADIHMPRYVTMTFLGSIIYLDDPRKFEGEAEKILATSAREIMETAVPTISPEMSIDDVASRMLEEHTRRLVVVDQDRRILGIITRADIVRMLAGGDGLPPE